MDSSPENDVLDANAGVGLGLRLDGEPENDGAASVPRPQTPPPVLQAEANDGPVRDIEVETTPEDRVTTSRETRTPPPFPESPSARLSVDASPRPPQSPRSPLRDHVPLHSYSHSPLGHESLEHVEVVLPESDLMVPAISLEAGSPTLSHPPAIDNAVFHEVHENPLQLSNPPSPYPRSPRRSPMASPVRHRSPISSPRPGHSPSPTSSKLSWRVHNHHQLVEKEENVQPVAMVTPNQLESGLSELLARASLESPVEEDESTSPAQKPTTTIEPGTPDSETTNVADFGSSIPYSQPVSRTDTLDLKSEPVKKDSGIDLGNDDTKEETTSPRDESKAPELHQQHIPRFFFRTRAEAEEAMDEELKKQWEERTTEFKETIASIFASEGPVEVALLTEPSSLLPFTINALSLPRYFNASCWRLAESETKCLDPQAEGVSRQGLERAWMSLRQACGRALLYEPFRDDAASITDSRAGEQVMSDVETVAFYAVMEPTRLREIESKAERRRTRAEKTDWVGWDDLELVVSDIVRNHPGLDFLQPLPIFQERYKDTVLARLMYLKPDFWDGQMTIRQFKATNFVRMVAELEENAEMTSSGQQVVGGVGDVNTTRDIFSYKHFYVIYCRFWELDTDHDMVISGKELLRYDVGRMTRRTVRRVSEALGRFTKPVESDGTKTKMEEIRSTERNWFRSLPADLDPEEAWQDAKLEYRDFVWIVLLVEDKSVPSAVSFWFRVLDTDDDGVLSLHELRGFWEEQIKRMREGRSGIPDPRNPTMVPGYWCGEVWDWPDFLCNLLDLSHNDSSPAEGFLSPVLPPACDPSNYDESYIHVTLPALRASNHAAHFFDLIFDLRSYDVHQRRMEPSFREADDVWVCDEDGNRKFKLRGWEKFSERQYEILANEERLAAQQQARAQQRQAQEKRNTRRLLFDDSNKASRTQTLDDSGDESSAKEDEGVSSRRKSK